MSQIEDLLAFQLRACKVPFEREVQLAKAAGRRYRWDFVVGDLAIEVQGATFVKGAHSSGLGIQRDYDKAYECLKAGFRPLSLTAQDVKSGEGLRKIQSLYKGK